MAGIEVARHPVRRGLGRRGAVRLLSATGRSGSVPTSREHARQPSTLRRRLSLKDYFVQK